MRLFWKIIVWIGSLVELYIGLHSCLCFSPLEKTILKSWLDTSSIPSGSVELLKPFSYRNPNSSLIPSGSIENAPASSIAPRHLVDRSSFCSYIRFLISRYPNCRRPFLDTYLNNFFNTSWYLICRALLKVLFLHPRWSVSHFFDLSRSVRACSSPKHSLFHSQPLPQGFFKLFQVFLHLVSF